MYICMKFILVFMFRKIVNNSKNQLKLTNTLPRRKVQLLDVDISGSYNYHYQLKELKSYYTEYKNFKFKDISSKCSYNFSGGIYPKLKSVDWSASELYRPSDRRFLEKLMPSFPDRGYRVVSATDSHGH
jgi:hypothetical protein